MLPRREFLRQLSLGSAALTVAPAVFGGAGPAAAAPAADSLCFATFTRLRGESFSLRDTAGRTHAVRLADTCEYQRGPRIENFTVQFSGAAAGLAAGTYRFSHDTFGAFDLFVTSHSRDARTATYEAVFNRLV